MACLVLAAGKGSRFGCKKQLVTINGQPMVNKILLEFLFEHKDKANFKEV